MNPQTLQTLAQPNRLDIVELLYKGPRSVNDIVDRLHLNQPQVSKHLRILADAGIVEVEPLAQQRFYRLKPQPFKALDGWLEKYRQMWNGKFDKLDTVLKKEMKKRK
ncbi:MAG TPA: metalloregulator ArsR/SmtB family transcription factor [Candidatus Eisenbacteria bacterium]|nr:metalloregulator ArsR/SmtB family transcription factor [Candidatus Eisenbacteria bacterium]